MASQKKSEEEKKKSTKTTSKAATKKTSSKTKTVGEKKTTTKKVATKATPKKTTTKKTTKKIEQKKVTPKKETPKKKTTTTSKKTKGIEKPESVILESVDFQEEYDDERTQIIHVIDEDFLVERTVEKHEKDNEKGIVVLFIVITFLFLVGLYYIYDYTKDQNANAPQDVDVLNEEKLNEGVNNASNANNNKKDSEEVSYDNIQTISIKDYKQKVAAKEKMIVLVASKYCGSCSVYEPVLDTTLGQVNKKAYKIDVATLETAEELNIFHSLFNLTGTPTVYIIENGEQKAESVGYRSQEATKAWIEENY